jgi:hypothetical protein
VIFIFRKVDMTEAPKDFIESEPLDRVSLAIGLRRSGAFVDFEDRDGMPDDWVRQRVQYVNVGWISQQDGQVRYCPERQGRALEGLVAGDSGMFHRAHTMGVFTLLIGGENES